MANEAEKQIKEALEKNVDLTDEEYKALYKKADEITKAHGIEGKAPISEDRRLKRMTANYQGLVMNTLCNLIALQQEGNALLRENNALLRAALGVEPEKEKENGGFTS